MRVAILVVSFVLTSMAVSQQALAPNAVQPAAAAARRLEGGQPKMLDAPPFGFWGSPMCDADQNLYFRTGAAATTPHIVRLTPGRDDNQVFAPPNQFQDVSLSAFTVSADNSVWMAVTVGVRAEVIQFSPKGDVLDEINLGVADDFLPENLVVFNSGLMLVSGFFGGASDPAHKGKALTALFQPSGRIYTEIGSGDHFALADLGKHPWDGGAALGWDGNVYILRQDRVLIYSESGKLLRTLTYDKPDPSLFSSRIDVSDGFICITLQKRPKNGPGAVTSQYLVIDADTAHAIGLYEPGPTVGVAMLCFSRQAGFLFSAPPPDSKTVPSHFGVVVAPLN